MLPRLHTALRSTCFRLLGTTCATLVLAVTSVEAGNVAIVSSSGSAANNADVQAKLVNSGFFGQVDIIDIAATTPSLAQLQAYSAVIMWSFVNIQDSTLLGDTLADYVDAGGGVVIAVYANSTTSTNRTLQGRWLSGGYPIIVQAGGTTTNAQATLGTVPLPSHPVMNGVTAFDGGSSSARPTTLSMTPGSSAIAHWSDGKILAAQHGSLPRRIDLGFFPPSNGGASASYWDQATDGGKLMANALMYVSASGQAFTNFCLGDGTGAPCPCGNTGASGRGCGSSSFPGGALLSISGVAGASVGTDTLVLTAADIPGPGLFFQSNGLAASPVTFGDGQLCATVGIVRLGVVFPVAGVAAYPGGLTPNPIHVQGLANSGDTKHYQCWYRSVPGLCSASNFDLTQGVTLVWGP